MAGETTLTQTYTNQKKINSFSAGWEQMIGQMKYWETYRLQNIKKNLE